MHNTTEHPLLTVAGFSAARQHVDTQFGRIAYVEAGDGPAAVFLHGFPLNSFHWRHQLTELSNDRRCIAIDMMGLGHSQVADDQDLSFNSQADMVLGAMDALDINRFDLIGNDTGGGIAQLLATKAPNRVTSLVLSNSDTHNNYPPKSLTTIHDAAGQNRLDDIFVAFLENPDSARNGLGSVVYENPMHLSDELLATYLRPLTATPARRRLVNRYIHSQDNAELVSIEPLLQKLEVPTLILWGTSDVFFDVEWAYWLEKTIPGAVGVIEYKGARLFFCEERSADVSQNIRVHWQRSIQGVATRQPLTP